MSEGVRVSGGATAEEVAAVVAALSARAGAPREVRDGYEGWRRGRLAALGRRKEDRAE